MSKLATNENEASLPTGAGLIEIENERPTPTTKRAIGYTLTVESGEKVTGTEGNHHFLLRIDKRERKAVSLSVFNCSVLGRQSGWGIAAFH